MGAEVLMKEVIKLPPRPVPVWRVTAGPFLGDLAQGHTKGEARAALKRHYGLPKLPTGTEMVRAEELCVSS